MQVSNLEVFKRVDADGFSIDFQYDPIDKILLMSVFGVYAPGNDRSGMGLGVADMQVRGCQRLLVDFRNAEHRMSIAEAYNRSKHAEEELIPRNYRYAFIFNELTDERTFAETVFVNRGWSFKVTDSFEDAITWLKDEF